MENVLFKTEVYKNDQSRKKEILVMKKKSPCNINRS